MDNKEVETAVRIMKSHLKAMDKVIGLMERLASEGVGDD